ncbi:transmembrane protein 176A isoform X2 [Neofelis nebulosa]|uniref:transmembrane protein 176A isoform X2 n=1 Tax=Neofelis nebulosa TaxID=61452 RepID=UPI00272C5BE7|nr:transmembrane protein 176A isoform X2 [Neofelis nebulosa]
MSTGMGTVESDEVAPRALQPTHIDVHIHQESALAKLLISGCSLLRSPISSAVSQTRSRSRILVASWAVLSGAVAFIYEKRGGIYWALLRTLLALAAFSTAIAAIIIGADNFYKGYFDFGDFICDVSSSTWYRGTPPPSTPSPEEVRRLHLCLSYLNMLKVLFISFQAMLLGVWALLLLASLVPVCLYCWKRLRCKETDQKKLLHVNEI